MPQYIASGGITFSGCALTSKILIFTHRWNVGDVLYLKHKAQKGILEKIAIKKVLLQLDGEIQFPTAYKDTHNGIHGESNLLSEQDALDLIDLFQQRQESLSVQNNCL